MGLDASRAGWHGCIRTRVSWYNQTRDMDMDLKVTLPNAFTTKQASLILKYLIDGDTVAALLHEVTDHFPAPVLVTLEQGVVVIAEYEVWKEKVLSHQRGIME